MAVTASSLKNNARDQSFRAMDTATTSTTRKIATGMVVIAVIWTTRNSSSYIATNASASILTAKRPRKLVFYQNIRVTIFAMTATTSSLAAGMEATAVPKKTAK